MTTPAPFKFECPYALRIDGKLAGNPTIHTRCRKPKRHHGNMHEGRGLERFPYQVIEWNSGHKWEYKLRDEELVSVNWEEERFYAWEE